MAEQELRFVDPANKEVILANGPFNLVTVGGLTVISFTQVRPRAEAMATPGVGKVSYDAAVVCRVALLPEAAQELARLIGSHQVMTAPAAGSAH